MPLVLCDSSAVTYNMRWTLHQVTWVPYNLLINQPLPIPNFSAVCQATIRATCPASSNANHHELSDLHLKLDAIPYGNFDSSEQGLAEYNCDGVYGAPCTRVEIWTDPDRLGGVRPVRIWNCPPAEPVTIVLTGTGDGYDGDNQDFEVHHVSEWNYTSPAVAYCRDRPGEWCILRLDCPEGPPCGDPQARGSWRRPRLRRARA